MRRVFGLHLIANALLIVLVYAWLGIRDARAWQIVLTVVLGAALIAATVWLHAGTWHWMRTQNWLVSREDLLRFAGGLLLFVVALWLLSLVPLDRAAQWTASLLTFKSRKPVSPDSMRRVFGAALWIVKWFVLPVVLLGQARRPRFWLLFAGLVLIGWFLPQRLVHWTPDFAHTWEEVLSVILRWGVAYVLAVASWLWALRQTTVARVSRD